MISLTPTLAKAYIAKIVYLHLKLDHGFIDKGQN